MKRIWKNVTVCISIIKAAKIITIVICFKFAFWPGLGMHSRYCINFCLTLVNCIDRCQSTSASEIFIFCDNDTNQPLKSQNDIRNFYFTIFMTPYFAAECLYIYIYITINYPDFFFSNVGVHILYQPMHMQFKHL